eukprot:355631_1
MFSIIAAILLITINKAADSRLLLNHQAATDGSISARLDKIKAKDMIIIEQIANNFLHEIDAYSRTDPADCSSFTSFFEANADPGMTYIGTGDFPNNFKKDEFIDWLCLAISLCCAHEDQYHASFSILSHQKHNGDQIITAASKNLVYSLMKAEANTRGIFINRFEWEFIKRKNSKTWLINKLNVDFDRIDDELYVLNDRVI